MAFRESADQITDTYAARYYSLFSALGTLLVSAVIARLLNMDFKEILILAGGIGATALGSAIPTERSVYSKATHDREVLEGQDRGYQKGAREESAKINEAFNEAGDKWENHMDAIDTAIGEPSDDDWLDEELDAGGE